MVEKMDPEECRLRLARHYKLTIDEADSLIQTAVDNLRKERLKQVRNQSREIAKKTLRNVKNAERKAFKEMSNTLQGKALQLIKLMAKNSKIPLLNPYV